MFINAGAPIIYWFIWLKPEIEADAGKLVVLEKNWWWFGFSWPMIIWGHVGIYGFPAFWGILTWIGNKGLNKIYEGYMDFFLNYIGTIMHFLASLGFLAGSGFWIDNEVVPVTRSWITSGIYVGWTVITFLWIGLTRTKSDTYMFLRHCDREEGECYIEQPAEDDEAEDEDTEHLAFVDDD